MVSSHVLHASDSPTIIEQEEETLNSLKSNDSCQSCTSDESSVTLSKASSIQDSPRSVVGPKSPNKKSSKSPNKSPKSPLVLQRKKSTGLHGRAAEERINMLRDEIARKSMSLKQLEQLAQELPRFGPTGRPLSSSSTISTPSSPRITMSPKSSPMIPDTVASSQAVAAAQAALNGITSASNASSTTSSPVSNASSSIMSASTYTSTSTTQYLHTKMTYDTHPSRSNWATTSHVIEHLQGTIDSLRRDLNEQNARATEEKQGREAIRKRCENTESQLEGLRHQNETLNSIISRKERRVKELEKDIEIRARRVNELENHQQEYIESKHEYEAMIKRVKEDKERAETAYKAAIDGSKAVKMAYEEKFTQIRQYLVQISEDQDSDKARINQLHGIIDTQRKEREQMEDVRAQMEKEHELHVQQIALLVEGFKEKLAANDRITEAKMKETVSLVNELNKTHLVMTRYMESVGTPE